MEFIRGIHNLKPQHRNCVATIGNFDGLHLGHQHVLQRLIDQAKQMQLPSIIIIFEPQPPEYFLGEKAPVRLLRLREKLMLLRQRFIDRVLCLRFNDALADLSAEKFVEDILVARLGIRWIAVGEDFRFGKNRQGDYALLEKLGHVHNFRVAKMETVTHQGQRVSSTRIRAALTTGDLTMVQQLLGRSYVLSGRVLRGDERGRQLGFPTANIALHRQAVPLQGVFVVNVHGLNSQPIPGVANIGNRPTVCGMRTLLEVHLLDFNQDIYGQHLEIEFLQKLRDEQRFASLQQLREQIAKDVVAARTIF